eukprot:4979689-Pleurochrysis_carterae.AAC.7
MHLRMRCRWKTKCEAVAAGMLNRKVCNLVPTKVMMQTSSSSLANGIPPACEACLNTQLAPARNSVSATPPKREVTSLDQFVALCFFPLPSQLAFPTSLLSSPTSARPYRSRVPHPPVLGVPGLYRARHLAVEAAPREARLQACHKHRPPEPARTSSLAFPLRAA